MNISLTPQLETLVKNKVESGLYGSASEVMRDALAASYFCNRARKYRQKIFGKHSLLMVFSQCSGF